jgi:hypothetical protein
MQKCVTLSVTEAEFVACVEVVQNMLFARRILESLELKVKMPMVVDVDNFGAVDLANSWTAAGHTRHTATRINLLRELKEQGLISVQWISSVNMKSDMWEVKTFIDIEKNMFVTIHRSNVSEQRQQASLLERVSESASIRRMQGRSRCREPGRLLANLLLVSAKVSLEESAIVMIPAKSM